VEERKRTPFKTTDLIIFSGLVLVAFVMLLMTNRYFGMVWDEGFYYPVYVKTRAWIWELVTNPLNAISKDTITLYWAERNEVPPVTKYIGALSIGTGFGGNPLLSMRIVFMVLFSLTVGLIFLIAKNIFRDSSVYAQILPSLLYLFHPRLFGHGHFAATETVFTFLTVFYVFVLVCFQLNPLKKILISYVILALALATKVNGLILIVASLCYLIYLIIVSKKNSEEILTNKQIVILFACYPLVFLLAWLIWPWMWYDTFDRIGEYWLFIRDHAHLAVWYLGEPYGDGEANTPWHYPIVMLFVVTPVITIISVASGFGKIIYDHFKAKDLFPKAEIVLLLLLIIGPLSGMIVTGAPKYDGIRLFIPVFAPLILFATPALECFKPSFVKVVFGIAVLNLLLENIPSFKTSMSYYNLPTVLASPDEPDFPFERTYWMESIQPQVFEDIVILSGKTEDEEIHVITRALFPKVFEVQQEWGTIPDNIVFNQGIDQGGPPYDFHLIQFRKGLWRNVDWALYAERENLIIDPLSPDNPRFLVLDGELYR